MIHTIAETSDFKGVWDRAGKDVTMFLANHERWGRTFDQATRKVKLFRAPTVFKAFMKYEDHVKEKNKNTKEDSQKQPFTFDCRKNAYMTHQPKEDAAADSDFADLLRAKDPRIILLDRQKDDFDFSAPKGSKKFKVFMNAMRHSGTANPHVVSGELVCRDLECTCGPCRVPSIDTGKCEYTKRGWVSEWEDHPVIPAELKSTRTVSGTRASSSSKAGAAVQRREDAQLAAVVGNLKGDFVAVGCGENRFWLGTVLSEPEEAGTKQVKLHGHYLKKGAWYFKIRYLEEDEGAGDRLYAEGEEAICLVASVVDVPGLPHERLELDEVRVDMKVRLGSKKRKTEVVTRWELSKESQERILNCALNKYSIQ